LDQAARSSGSSSGATKPRLGAFDRAELLQVIHDLYAVSRDNQAFLHARLDLGSDPLRPHKETISRWICPDVYRQHYCSVSKAKKAIVDYKTVGTRLHTVS
jgi:hypothetical protein